MNRAEAYAWVTGPPSRRPLPPPRPARPKRRHRGLTFLEAPCPSCGFHPIGWRKRCPACLRYRPPEVTP